MGRVLVPGRFIRYVNRCKIVVARVLWSDANVYANWLHSYAIMTDVQQPSGLRYVHHFSFNGLVYSSLYSTTDFCDTRCVETCNEFRQNL